MFKEILTSPWMIGAAVTAALWLVARFTDPEKAYEAGKARGKWLSAKMRATKLGAKAWEKVEDFIQRLFMAYVKGWMDGLDSDDTTEETKDEKPS